MEPGGGVQGLQQPPEAPRRQVPKQLSHARSSAGISSLGGVPGGRGLSVDSVANLPGTRVCGWGRWHSGWMQPGPSALGSWGVPWKLRGDGGPRVLSQPVFPEVRSKGVAWEAAVCR